MMLRTALLRAPLARIRLAHPIGRTFHTTRPALSGLTNLFEASDNPPLSVDKLTNDGFLLSDGLVVPGGVIFADGRAFMWDVDPPHLEAGGTLEGAWKGWTKERFEVFEKLVPRPEILVLGTGARVLPAPKAIRDYISSLGIQLDVMDTRNAASTYNLLSEEGRTISAALCPEKAIDSRTGLPREQ